MLATIERTGELEYWPLMRLRPNPLNPRGPVDPASVMDLAASIRSQGILQPLLIIPDGTVVAGHRRLAGGLLAECHMAPVIIRDLAINEQLEIMLVENLQRQDLTPIQEARAYRRLIDAGCRQSDVARKVGVTVSRVQHRLMLLKLDPAVQDLVSAAELPLLLTPILGKVGDPTMQRRLAMMASRKRLSVAQLEKIVAGGQGVLSPEKPRPQPAPVTPAAVEEGPDISASSSLTRKQAIKLLMGNPKRQVTLADVAKLFDSVCGICGDCGMSELESVCAECPLPQLATRLTRK
jgi:ParB/RepB/Spo0J family partition protein